MKKGLLLILLIGFIVSLSTVVASAAEPVYLQLDGNIIETDVEPILENDRTLIPYRALLEAMGAEVSWEQKALMATAELGRQRVQVTIDSTTGFVNGMAKTMDVPPRLVNNRTMIPLRFVLENLNCKVDWDPASRTVLITSPEENDLEVISVTSEIMDSCYRVIAECNDMVTGISSFAYEKPHRYGIDIKNAVLSEGVGSFTTDYEVFYNVRYSQLDEETVRIVVDLNEEVAGKVSLSEDRKTIYLDFDFPGQSEKDISRGGETKPEEPPSTDLNVELPQLDWRAEGKLIVIDAGHGGGDPGAEGMLKGHHLIWEKELNLSIALRLYQLLTDAGANVNMLRDSDTYMSLYSRPEAANSLNGDLLISIHNNSSDNPNARGTEVLYYNKEKNYDNYGFDSKYIAQYVLDELVIETGLPSRGIKKSPHLAVLNKSLMPAIIIEGGFLSNREDLEVMLKDEFIEAYAVAVARGVINALNASVDQTQGE